MSECDYGEKKKKYGVVTVESEVKLTAFAREGNAHYVRYVFVTQSA